MGNKTIKQVYGRNGRITTAKGFQIRKRVVGANRNCQMAQANLSGTSPWTRIVLKLSTIKTYWSEYNMLSTAEKKVFKDSYPDQLAKLI